MNNLFNAPVYKTINKMTAKEVIAAAKIIKTQSNDYLIRVGGYDLALTENDRLSVADYGTTICVMDIDDDDYDKIKDLEAQVEARYCADQLAQSI